MIIELLGPSGSGKTTAVDQLDQHEDRNALALLGAAALRQVEDDRGWRGARECKRLAKVRWFLPIYWRYSGIAWPLLCLTILQGSPFRWRSANRALAVLSMSVHLEKSLGDRVAVLDEGFVQALWALLIGSKALRGAWLIRRLLISYQRLLDPVAVALTVEPAIARDRVFLRQSKGRFNSESNAEQRRQFEEALGHHRRILTLMPDGMLGAQIDAGVERGRLCDALVQTIARLRRRYKQPGLARIDERILPV